MGTDALRDEAVRRALDSFRERLRKLVSESDPIDSLLPLFSPKVYARGESFARAGWPCGTVATVATGLFYVEEPSEEGAIIVKDFIGPDRILIASYGKGGDSGISITALRESLVLEARWSDVLELYARYPSLAEAGRTVMEREMSRMCSRVGDMIAHDAGERYEAFLDREGDLVSEIPGYLLASWLGVTPTQLSRIRAARSRSLARSPSRTRLS